ncbi:ADP-ribosylglycohydrolase family protein [Geofilum rubicundum]|uniref:Putative ADP-ribosylglycohydrolase n=1 Tax=Geofilum rubicundum JCM 15548 TaxID=1236989 RepID=A0A0E9LXG9_9BACT|nr:ADP-ribosylglycohydrolase family protein [Geofilum rubicundum]GAO29934.1 putative ADP-ribosylglycohydrolase [Geofilum rubicundum JCM 15548]
MNKVSVEHYEGCLLGGAVGDALGAPIEFLSLDRIRELYGPEGVTGYVEFEDGHGEFTDDTQMTLFTAEGLLRAYHRGSLRGIWGALNTIVHHSYLRWLVTQGTTVDRVKVEAGEYDMEAGWMMKQRVLYSRRAPGNTCLSALESGVAGSVEEPINNSKGCGTIMRVAPVGLLFMGEAEEAFRIACETSAITHGHVTGYLSAGVLAAIISELAVGKRLTEGVAKAKEILKRWEGHGETLRAIEKAEDLFVKMRGNRDRVTGETLELLGGGWIAEEALSMSLLASLLFEDDFTRGVLFSVNHGGDCDSTGSITGNILGLIHGVRAIPADWVVKLKGHEVVKAVAGDLHLQIKTGEGMGHNAEWMERYPAY